MGGSASVWRGESNGMDGMGWDQGLVGLVSRKGVYVVDYVL